MLGWKVQKVQKVQNKTKKSASKEFRKKVKYLFCYIQDTLSLKKDTELCYCVSGSALYCFMVFIRAQLTEMWWAASSEHRWAHSHAMWGERDWRWEAAWLTVSLMQQIMNQRRQSLTRDKRWHSTDGDRGSKSMLLRELLQRWKGFPGEAALFWAFNNQDAGDDHEQLPSVQWDTGLSVTILKYHSPQGTSQLGWLLVFLIILIITEPLMSWK